MQASARVVTVKKSASVTRKVALATNTPTVSRVSTAIKQKIGRLRRSARSIARMEKCALRIISARSLISAGTSRRKTRKTKLEDAWRCTRRKAALNSAGNRRIPQKVQERRWKSTLRMANSVFQVLLSMLVMWPRTWPSAPQPTSSSSMIRSPTRPTTAQRRTRTRNAILSLRKASLMKAMSRSSAAAPCLTRLAVSVRV